MMWVLHRDFEGLHKSRSFYILDELAWEKIEGIEILHRTWPKR
jgi:hypothetical protein